MVKVRKGHALMEYAFNVDGTNAHYNAHYWTSVDLKQLFRLLLLLLLWHYYCFLSKSINVPSKCNLDYGHPCYVTSLCGHKPRDYNYSDVCVVFFPQLVQLELLATSF